MTALLNRTRLAKLASFASAQLLVQGLGILAGIVLVRVLAQADYGHYTLAASMVGLASVLLDLGLATAVLALGGPLHAEPQRLGALLGDAFALQRRLSALLVPVLLVGFTAMFLTQGLGLAQSAALVLLVLATTLLNVRSSLWLSVVRLRGDLRLQQRLEIAVNLGKLLVVLAAALVFINATLAVALNLLAALATLAVLRGYLARRFNAVVVRTLQFDARLRNFVRRQAPNSLYYCVSGQIVVWLVGWFGGAERVAEVGALGRLAMLFALIGAVITALVQPFFARGRQPRELVAGFLALNLFFLLLTLLLVGLAAWVPGALLWILGPRYGGLQRELVWVLLSAALASWSGAAYAVGAGRGWVVPSTWMVLCGTGSITLAAMMVDVATVAGGFIINTAAAAMATVLTIAFVSIELRRLARRMAAPGRSQVVHFTNTTT